MPLFRGRDRAARALERRDPTAATTQLRWHGRDQPQVQDWDAQRAVQFGYQANVIAYRATCVVADTLAAYPFRAGAAQPESPGVAAPHNPAARLAQLLGPPPGGPAPGLTAKKLWTYTAAQRLVTGRNGWEIELDGDSIVAFWPLASSALRAVPSKDGNRWWAKFEYGRPDDLVELKPEQVHYGWTASLNDFRQPDPSLVSAKYPIEIASAIERYQYGFMRNGAVPGTIVGVEAFAEAADFEAFKRQWGMSYEGPDNAGRTHFVELDPGEGDTQLSQALFVQTVGATMRDSRTPESYKQALELIAISLGVPWSKLDASGRTFDNASEEDRTFWQSTVLPLATDLQDEVNVSLAPRLGPEVGWFDFSSVRALQPVPVAGPGDIPGLIMAGVITADEARPWLYLNGTAPEPVTIPTQEVDDNDDEEPGAVDGRAGRPGEAGQEAREAAGEEEAARQVRGATAFADLPLSDRGRSWDAGAARKSLTDAPAETKRRAHLWVNPDGDPDTLAAYKFPIATLESGSLTAVWRGVTAAAGRLSSADIPAADKRRIQSHLGRYYAKARKKYDDPGIKAPWDNRDARAAVDFHEARRATIWRATDALVRSQEAVWERQWRRLFAKQERAALTRLRGNNRSKVFEAAARDRRWGEERGPADGIFDPAFWVAETAEMAASLYEGTAGVAFGQITARFGISFDLESEFAQRFIMSRSNQLAGLVTQTTYNALKATLAEGVGDGESIPRLAARIRGVFEDATSYRATTIARTEVISAFNASSNLAASTLPGDVVAAKEWISTADGRTRPSHSTAGGQVVHISAPFSVGGQGAMYPGDPTLSAKESVNCRCTVAFLTPDEYEAWQAAQTAVPLERARTILAMVADDFDETRIRRAALEVAV